MRKRNSPNQTEYTEHDQRHAYPMDQLIGRILVMLSILIKIPINWPGNGLNGSSFT